MKKIIDLLIILCMALIVSIFWTGGFEVQIVGKEISAHGLTNPILAALILTLLRFCLSVGWKNSVIFFSSLTVALILAELFLRVINLPITQPTLKNIMMPSDVLSYQLVPLIKGENIRINSHGLRDRERSWDKPEGVTRVLGIGDSFTFGYEVREEDCYLKQLELLLNEQKTKWDVINAGVTGYNMWQYLAYLRCCGYKYSPDLITIGVFFDDFYGDPSPPKKVPQVRRYRSLSFIRLVNFTRNLSDLLMFRYRYLFDASWLRSIEKRREHIFNKDDYLILTGKADPELFKKYETRLKSISNVAKRHNAKVLVLFIPDIVQLNYPEFKVINRILKEICKKCGVEYLDLTRTFECAGNTGKLYMMPHDAHTSPAGHKIIAGEMKKKILAMMKN